MSLKLDIGTARSKFEDYVTVDCNPFVKPDIVWDIEEGYCGPEEYMGEVDEIRASHVLEHISPKNRVAVMVRLHALLKQGGELNIVVPDGRSVQFFQDPTHLCPWIVETFWYFTKGNKFGEAFHRHRPDSPLFETVDCQLLDGWKVTAKLTK